MVRLIDAGTLAPGDRLPPTRVLAGTAGVHRSSVLRAYGELWALGYLESRPGSYTTIRRRAPTTASVRGDGGSSLDWAAITNAAVCAVRAASDNLASQSPPPPDVIDPSRLSADRRLTPLDDVRRSIRTVLADEGRDLLDYGDPSGYRPLREAMRTSAGISSSRSRRLWYE